MSKSSSKSSSSFHAQMIENIAQVVARAFLEAGAIRSNPTVAAQNDNDNNHDPHPPEPEDEPNAPEDAPSAAWIQPPAAAPEPQVEQEAEQEEVLQNAAPPDAPHRPLLIAACSPSSTEEALDEPNQPDPLHHNHVTSPFQRLPPRRLPDDDNNKKKDKKNSDKDNKETPERRRQQDPPGTMPAPPRRQPPPPAAAAVPLTAAVVVTPSTKDDRKIPSMPFPVSPPVVLNNPYRRSTLPNSAPTKPEHRRTCSASSFVLVPPRVTTTKDERMEESSVAATLETPLVVEARIPPVRKRRILWDKKDDDNENTAGLIADSIHHYPKRARSIAGTKPEPHKEEFRSKESIKPASVAHNDDTKDMEEEEEEEEQETTQRRSSRRNPTNHTTVLEIDHDNDELEPAKDQRTPTKNRPKKAILDVDDTEDDEDPNRTKRNRVARKKKKNHRPKKAILDVDDTEDEMELEVQKKTKMVATVFDDSDDEMQNEEEEGRTRAPNEEETDDDDKKSSLTLIRPPERRVKANQKSVIHRHDAFYDTLGSLRPGKAAQIQLLEPLDKYSEKLGRVYYGKFRVVDRNGHAKEFAVGSTLYMRFANQKSRECVFVAAIFQATKSFSGWNHVKNENKTGTQAKMSMEDTELQKRGHPYMIFRELQTRSQNKKLKKKQTCYQMTRAGAGAWLTEWLGCPEWKFEHTPPHFELEGAEVEKMQEEIRTKGLWDPGFPKFCRARQVQFVQDQYQRFVSKKRRGSKTKLPIKSSVESSDDSDGFDSESERHLRKTGKEKQVGRRKKKTTTTTASITTSYSTWMEAQEASDDEEMSVQEVQEASDDEEMSEQEDDENEKTGKKAGEKTRPKVSEQVPHWKQRWVVDADWEEMEASSFNAARKTALVLMQPFKKLFPELASEINDVCLELKDVVDIQYVDAEDTGIMNIRQVTRSLLDKAKARLQLESLKTLQQVVCTEAIEHPGKDIIVNAPCGFGKTMCFLVPAVLYGGITIVVEPLRALIESLLQELKKRQIPCEKLLKLDEAKGSCKTLPALDRLADLAKNWKRGKEPLVIVTTPELIYRDAPINQLSDLSKQGKLARIVIDEFDLCVEEGMKAGVSREAYASIVPMIRRYLTTVPIMFLSATASESVVKIVTRKHGSHRKPKLFIHCDPLPKHHFYMVERKTTADKVASRIKEILDGCEETKPKAVCYFVGKKKVYEFQNKLKSIGLSSGTFVRAETPDEKESNNKTLKEFKSPEMQVLCANSALGRGVDDLPKDVRFCFHVQMPESLDEYLQQTGRAGRDGKLTYCYMFFRLEDRTTLREIYGRQPGNQQEAMESKLSLVTAYAWNGSICRREALARSTLVRDSTEVRCSVADGRRILCDNCAAKLQPSNQRSVTHRLTSFLKKMKAEFSRVPRFNDIEQNNQREYGAWHNISRNVMRSLSNIQEKDFIQNLLSGCSDQSLLHDLVQYMNETFEKGLGIHERSMKTRSKLIDNLIQRTENGKVGGFQILKSLPPENLIQVASGNHLKISLEDSIDKERRGKMPILVQYGLQKLSKHRENHSQFNAIVGLYAYDDDNHDGRLEKACKYMSQCKGLKHLNMDLLLDAERTGHGLYWTGTVRGVEGVLELCAPEPARDRRIFRRFGADRFLTLRVKKDVPSEHVKELFAGKGISEGCSKRLFDRTYRYLWCKKDKDPQQFVLFAEKGPGLTPITVKQVVEWAMPQDMNKTMTIAKRMKRMKLMFSKTTPTAALPKGSVVIVPDFDLGNDFAEIDGCGLISLPALNMVWERYQEQLPILKRSDEKLCPYTGFQGRLGGFKGTWVLDTSLGSEIVVHCRTSQLKFCVPQSCLVQYAPSNMDEHNEEHNIFEVSTWDKEPGAATLNARIIQQLEHLGVPWEFFETHCLKPAIADLECLSRSGDEARMAWVKHLREKQRNGVLRDTTDSRQCLMLECATVGLTDPELRRFKRKLVAKMFRSLQEKANYPLPGCVYLRMYADHTMLMEEGEAFVATSRLNKSAEEILAMRSPSYFAGDLRRLKLVSLTELKMRANDKTRETPYLAPELMRSGEESFDFFSHLSNCIVLCNKGKRSEADKMSGGDYDGDLAWVSWNKDLLMHVQPENPPMEVDDIVDQPHPLGQIIAWGKDNRLTEVSYARKSFLHHVTLGKLATQLDAAIDYKGFDSEEARQLGRASFLQVDVPDTPFLSDKEYRDITKRIRTPDWCVKCVVVQNSYRSEKVLGRLFRTLRETMNRAIAGMEESELGPGVDPRVEKIVKRFRHHPSFQRYWEKMASAVDSFLADKAKYMESHPAKDSTFATEEETEEHIVKMDQWKIDYFKQKRFELMDSDGGWVDSGATMGGLMEVKRDFRAALLYKVGWDRDKEWMAKRKNCCDRIKHSYSGGPMEFVWGVAGMELLRVFCPAENSLLISAAIEPALFAKS